MTTATITPAEKKAIHDKIETQYKNAEAKFNQFKTKADASKNKIIAEINQQKSALELKIKDLKTTTDEKYEHAKNELQTRLAEFTKSVDALGQKKG